MYILWNRILPQFYENILHFSGGDRLGRIQEVLTLSNGCKTHFFHLPLNFVQTIRLNIVIWLPLSQKGYLHISEFWPVPVCRYVKRIYCMSLDKNFLSVVAFWAYSVVEHLLVLKCPCTVYSHHIQHHHVILWLLTRLQLPNCFPAWTHITKIYFKGFLPYPSTSGRLKSARNCPKS